jgi:hypothetical protein
VYSPSHEFSLIKDLLEARGYIEWRQHLSKQAINRRQFLTGAAGTAAALAASSALAAEIPIVAKDTHTGTVTLTFKGYTWAIDPRRFADSEGKKPHATGRELATRDSARPRFSIQLANAGLAGVNSSIRADFNGEIYGSGTGWRIRLKFRSMPRAMELDLAQWLSRAARVTEQFSGGRIEIGLGKTVVTVPQQGARLSIDADFAFQFGRYDRPLNLEIERARALIDGVTLRPQIGGSALLTAIANPPAGGPVTFVEIPCVKPSDGHITVGRLPDGEEFSLYPETINIFAEAYGTRRPDALIVLDGCGALRCQGRHVRPTFLQVERVCLVGLSNNFTARAVLGAKIARHRFGMEVGAFAVVIQGKANDPITLRVHGGEVPKFSLTVELLEADVPSAGASAAEVCFPAIDLLVTFGQQKKPPHQRDPQFEKAVDEVRGKILVPPAACDCPPGVPAAAAPLAAGDVRGPHLEIGPKPLLTLPLERARLKLRRSVDLFNLSFGFRYYELEVKDGKTTLRLACPAGAAAKDARLVAYFPPQHVFEEAAGYSQEWWKKEKFSCQQPAANGSVFPKGHCGKFEVPPSSAQGNACTPQPPLKDGCRVEPVLRNVPDIDIAYTRISGPTRIVFSDARDVPPSEKELTIDSLTDWAELSLEVHHRALRAGATLDDQLAAARPADNKEGITETTDRATARQKIVQSLTAPSDWQTAIELPFRMLLSPDGTGKFETPRGQPTTTAPVLWHTRLRQDRKTAVRAVYARHMRLGFLDPDGGEDADDLCFIGSMSALDRRELVGLTSVYGVAALRRLQKAKANPNPGDPAIVQDDPRGMVVRPKKYFAMLDKPAKYMVPFDPEHPDVLTPVFTAQEGFIVAKPFDKAEIMLTAVGGTLSAKWIGEPPAPFQDPDGKLFQFFRPAYTVEKYVHRTQIGRDAYVELNYKGFYLPTGHRVADIKLSERMFLPHRLNPDFVRPAAYLAQRRFQVVRQPRKSFPAFGQDFSSRDFPCKFVEFATATTPDLDPRPQYLDLNRTPPEREDDKCKTKQTVGRVFWPRTAPGACNVTISVPTSEGEVKVQNNYGNEVIFELKVSDDQLPVRAPLLFVDNAAAHDAETMARVVAYYRALPWDGDIGYLRRAEHGDTPRVYAEPGKDKDGDTSYVTRTWVLSARGRLVADQNRVGAVTESFLMDAFMEGADQPPFYPVMQRARLTMQRLDRLLGRAQGLIDVAFNEVYVRRGFDKAHNPAEIYLDVIKPRIQLDVSGQGQSTGGVAKPNAMLACVSRSIGFVGGRAIDIPDNPAALPACAPAAPLAPLLAPPLAPSAPPPAPPIGNSEGKTFNFDAAAAGRFDPVEFFGGALKDAKLLGLISLKDVLRAVLIVAAPKLNETVAYGVDKANAEAAQLTRAVTEALLRLAPIVDREIRQAVDIANRALDKLNAQFPAGSPPLTVQSLYPELANSFAEVQRTTGKITSQLKPDNEQLQIAISFATQLLSDVKALLATIERLIENPVPAVVTDALAKIQQAWSDVRSLFETDKLKTVILDQLRNLLKGAAESAGTALLEEVCHLAIASGMFPALWGRLDLDITPPRKAGPSAPEFDKPASPKPLDAQSMHEACMRLLRKPGDALPRLQEALFYEVFSQPLFAAIEAFKRLDGQVQSVIVWSRQAVAERVVAILRAVTAEVSHKKLPAVAWEIIAEIEKITQGDLGTDPLRTITERAVTARGAIEAIVKSEVAGWRAELMAEIDRLQRDINKKKQDLERTASQLAKDRIKAEIEALGFDLKKLEPMREAYNRIAAGEARAVADEIVVQARRELERQLGAYEQEAKEFLKESARGQAERVIGLVEKLIEAGMRSALFGEIAQLSHTLMGWCDGAGVFVTSTRDFAIGLIDRVEDIGARARALVQQLEQTKIPAELPGEIAARLQQGRASLSQSLQSLVTLLIEIERARKALQELKPAEACTKIGDMLDLVGRTMELRRRATEIVHDAIHDADRMVDAIALVKQSQSSRKATMLRNGRSTEPAGLNFAALMSTTGSLDAVEAAVKTIGTDVAQLLRGVTSLAKVAANTLPWRSGEGIKALTDAFTTMGLAQATTEIRDAINDIQTVAKRLDQDITDAIAANDLKKLKGLAQQVADYAVKHDRRLAALALRAGQIGNEFETKLRETGLAMINGAAKVLLIPHEVVLKALDALTSLLVPNAGGGHDDSLTLLLTKPLIDQLEKAKQPIRNDQAALTSLATVTQVSVAATAVDTLLKRWRQEGVGLVVATRNIGDLVTRVANGHIDAIFDFEPLKQQLLQVLSELIPAEINLSYDFDSELGSYPSDDPVFAMDRESIGAGFDSIEPPAVNDLVLSARIKINLISGERQVSATGHIRPFIVRLLGERLDLITIYFNNAHFEAKPGQDPSFHADMSRVEIGKELAFIAALSEVFGDGEDNKPYALPMFSPPGIEVGYRYSKFLIELGELQFINLAIHIAATLPFDDRSAQFRFAFASRARPFIIAAPPYGGGGFVAMTGNARGIVSFEISFEFGCCMAVEFGPLHAFGCVTAGIYLMIREGVLRSLEGFVHAIGEGNIACFGIAVNIEVKVTQSGSSMTGSATYEVTFKVGIAEVSYGFEAAYQFAGGSGAGGGGAAGGGGHGELQGSRTMFAAADLPIASDAPPLQLAAVGGMAPAPAAAHTAQITNNVPIKSRDWRQYRKHVAIGAW